jgi:hypothetical protein
MPESAPKQAKPVGAPRAGGPDPTAGGRGGMSVARKLALWGTAGALTVVLVTGLGIGLSAAGRAYSRAEQRADAQNRVTLTHIAISRAEQQALITRAQIQATQADADKRFAEAVGIRRAQNEISSTLTAHYLQYEAIQAQKAVATSGRNNTLIYVPSGPNGVPLTQDPQNVNRLRPAPAG